MNYKEQYEIRFDPDLQDAILSLVKEIKQIVPEQRFGQIIRNAVLPGTTIYHIEDIELLGCLERYKSLMEKTKKWDK